MNRWMCGIHCNLENAGSGGRGGKLSSQLWKLVSEKDDYKQEFISKWRSSGLDLCIGPTYACPAPLSKDIGRLYCTFNLSFSSPGAIFLNVFHVWTSSGRFVHYSVQLLGFTCRNCARHSRKRGGSKEIGRLQYFRCPCETGEAGTVLLVFFVDFDGFHWSAWCSFIEQTTTGAHGLPIGVQIIGLPYQEELIFHGMDILSSIAKAWSSNIASRFSFIS